MVPLSLWDKLVPSLEIGSWVGQIGAKSGNRKLGSGQLRTFHIVMGHLSHKLGSKCTEAKNTKQGRKKGKLPLIPPLRRHPSDILFYFLLNDYEHSTSPHVNNFILRCLSAIILKNMFKVIKMLYKHMFKCLQIFHTIERLKHLKAQSHLS